MVSAADDADNCGREQPQLSNDDYKVGWICALATEYVAAQVFLDEEHMPPTFTATHDNNDYTLGRIGKHNVAIAVLPGGEYGTASAAGVARDMLHTFANIRIGLMVGIGGGAPTSKHDIRLGDVVVSKPGNGLGGVFQYDFGKSIQDQPFQSTRFLAPPPPVLLTAMSGLTAKYEKDGHSIQQDIETCLVARKRLRRKYSRPDTATDRLYQSDIVHPLSEESCVSGCGSDAPSLIIRTARGEDDDDPAIHHGLIATANQLMKDAKLRDQFANERGILCFETEAGGLMNHFPCLVIRGICDYSDTHKNKEWQGYAAMTAAAYTKDLLKRISPNKVEAEKRISELVEDVLSVAIDTKNRVQSLQTSAHLDKIVRWLSAPDTSTNLNNARKLHERGTGQWLLESDKYQSWKADSGSFLWLFGDAGCGKTILSSTVVADLAGDTTTSQSLLYFYFDFGNKAKRSTEGAVRSLIDQLYRKRIETRAVVDSLYATHEKDGGQPTYASLEKALQDMIAKCSNIWIILDGVDECEGRDTSANGSVMTWIKNLRRGHVHILVTSRPEQDIESFFDKWLSTGERIALQSGLVADDITAYINAEVERMDRWREDQVIQQLMVTTLNKGANGMFRWVACQFDTLNRCISRPNIRKELESLPATLYDTYKQMFERIYPGHRSDAIRLLQLLTYSPRPLRIEEVVDAIAVDPESTPAFDPDDRIKPAKAITQYCSGFVSLTTHVDAEKKSDVTEIQLAHFSVQEYFQSDKLPPNLAAQLSKTAAAASLVDLCLSYLPELDTSLSANQTKEQYPFAEFSAQYWADYAVIVEASSQQVPKAVKEYYARHDAFILGYKIYRPDCEQWEQWERDIKEVSPLYYASFAGLSASVRMLLEADANTNVQCGYLGNALQAASHSGHDRIVQSLIQHGADVHAQGGRYGNALQAASFEGHYGIVQMLIQHGADVHAQGGAYGNALYAASFEGHHGIVRILIQHGANVNTQDGHYGNALYAAASGGHDGIVQALIQHGANVNAQGVYYGNALQAASYGGHDGIVQTLIQHGADVNAQDGHYGNALYAAASGGYDGIVQALIQHGANVNAQGGAYGNALQAASEGGHHGIVQMLIQQGADVNAQGGSYANALQAASFEGHHGIVQTLIQHGADVNAQGGHYSYYGSALQAASFEGHDGIVQTLIQHGADVNAQGGEYGNALYGASFEGHHDIVQTLIQHGADVNAQDGYYDNALQAASERGHQRIVKMLIQHGADVNAQGGLYGNALQAASYERHQGVVQLLLESGAVMDIQGGKNNISSLSDAGSEETG